MYKLSQSFFNVNNHQKMCLQICLDFASVAFHDTIFLLILFCYFQYMPILIINQTH